jgi:hypothetical protein
VRMLWRQPGTRGRLGEEIVHRLTRERWAAFVMYAQKQAAGDYAVAEIVKDISPNACQHVHLIGAFDFEQTESQIDIDALAARYDDPDFWNRALVEAPDDSLTQPLDRTLTVLERWAFLSIKVKGQWVYLYRAVDKQGLSADLIVR